MNYQLAVRASYFVPLEQLAFATVPTVLVVAAALLALGQLVISTGQAVVMAMGLLTSLAPLAEAPMVATHPVAAVVTIETVVVASAGVDHLAKPKQYPSVLALSPLSLAFDTPSCPRWSSSTQLRAKKGQPQKSLHQAQAHPSFLPLELPTSRSHFLSS